MASFVYNKYMKRSLIIASMIIFLIVIISLVLYPTYQKNKNSKQSPEIIGGQKDDHGCLIAAGYSWCEQKKKCLRTWEEPCAAEVISIPVVTEEGITYKNEKYNFQLRLPESWEGYKSSEMDYPAYSSISFSFSGQHQPFSIFSILKFTAGQWDQVENHSSFKVLKESNDGVLVCDGCCGINNDYQGGGQFDEFQIARCKEGAEIVQTFKSL
jgi:hypothetical protein